MEQAQSAEPHPTCTVSLGPQDPGVGLVQQPPCRGGRGCRSGAQVY